MAKFIQYMTRASLYDGAFDNESGWPAAGMGYVIATEGGRLMVIDGGQPDDGEALLELLAEQVGGERIFVDRWIITHPHLDHYGAMLEMCKNEEMKKRVSVGEVIYLFPDEIYNSKGELGAFSDHVADMLEICKAMGAKGVAPQRGDVIALDDVTVEFLFVPDDCSVINTSNGKANLCSLIFTVEGKERKVMVTGDAYRRSMQITAWRYGNKLKCDILQMPHHALCDAFCVDFYRYVDAEELLLPISSAGYRAMHSKLYDSLEGCIANLCLEAKAKGVYKAFEGNAELYI